MLLVVSFHERKLAKHVKGVREKKRRRDKERAFHRLPPSITRTFSFILCTTLFPIIRSTRNEKYKRERRRTTNLNYPNNYIHGEETALKTSSKLLPPCSGEVWAYIGKISGTGGPNWAIQGHASKYDAWLHDMAVETRPWSRFRGHAAVAHAALQRGPCTCSMSYVLFSAFLFSAPCNSKMGFQSQWLY